MAVAKPAELTNPAAVAKQAELTNPAAVAKPAELANPAAANPAVPELVLLGLQMLVVSQ